MGAGRYHDKDTPDAVTRLTSYSVERRSTARVTRSRLQATTPLCPSHPAATSRTPTIAGQASDDREEPESTIEAARFVAAQCL